MPLGKLKITTEPSGTDAPEFDPKIEPQIADGLFEPDPVPAEAPVTDGPGMSPPPATRRGRPSLSSVPAVTKSVEKEVREEIEALLKICALTASIRDPVCAGVFSDQTEKIAAALVNLLKRNPALLARLRQAGWMGDWVALGMAVLPVGRAIYEHHVKADDQETPDEYGSPGYEQFPPYIPRNGAGNAQVA